MEKKLRCAIYIRVSTWEQATYGKSLIAQKECLENYAKDHGMTVIGIYADEGQTARKELKKRKAIHALLAEVKQDQVDVILFWRMDRWFRNVSDFYKVQDILDAHGTTWIDVGEPNINMKTRDGRLSLNLALAIGQNEVDTTSERIKFTVDNTIKNGGMVWGEVNLPFGYKIDVIGGKKRMVKNEKEAPVVEEVYKYFLENHGKRQTVVHIQEMFGIPFSYGILRNMLKSEFYIGKYRDNTNYCPAYLTLEQWEKVQEMSKNNVKSAPSGRIYLFSGMMRCPICGQKLCGTGCNSIINRTTKEKKTYCYYRCNRHFIDNVCSFTGRVSQNLVESYLLDHIQDEYHDFYSDQISAQRKAEKVKKKGRSADQIIKERERLNVLFQKGRISYDYYDREYTALDKELNESKIMHMQKETKASAADYEKLLSEDFRQIYQKMTAENRRSFWRSVIKEIVVDENKSVVRVLFF